MYYDLLHSPDAVVPDVRVTARLLVERLGLPEPKPGWFQSSACHGYTALFARVHPSRAVAPSRIEAIAPAPRPLRPDPADVPANVGYIAALQADRPLKTHATVLTTSRFAELAAGLARNGVRHRIDPPSRDLGHERLWIGFTGAEYSPADDAGLFFEVIPTQCLELPEAARAALPAAAHPDLAGLAPGGMIRVAARSYLVADISKTAGLLEDRLGWPVERLTGTSGARRAVMAVNFPRSARFELIEPGYDPDAAAYFGRWGPGTYATRITVDDLAARAGELRDRGAGFRRRQAGAGGPDVLRVDPDVVPGFLFDFIDETAERQY